MRRWAAWMVMACSILLLAASGFSLSGMLSQEWKDDALQEQLKDIFEDGSEGEDKASEKDKDTKTRGVDGTAGGSPDRVADTSGRVHPGLAALQKENPDCIGWIRIDGTVIDYPVMYRPAEENYYLHRDFYGKYSANGCLFLSETCYPKTSDNLIIYGHHMKSGKMFAALEKYKENSFYKEHPLISFQTLHGEETYQVFSVFCTAVGTGDAFPYYAFVKAQDKETYQEYVRAVKQLSVYDTGITAVYGDKLLALSTCEYSRKNGRIVIAAKKIRQQE